MERFNIIVDNLLESTGKLANTWRGEVNNFTSLENAKFSRTILEPISNSTKELLAKTESMKNILRRLEEKDLI